MEGVECRRLEPTYDSAALFAFNKTHGSTPHNFAPNDAPRIAHLNRLATGEAWVWGAFRGGDELVGFMSGERSAIQARALQPAVVQLRR